MDFIGVKAVRIGSGDTSEVQKSSVFKVCHENAGVKSNVDNEVSGLVSGITGVNLSDNVNYSISSEDSPTTQIQNYNVASYVSDPTSILAINPAGLFTANRPGQVSNVSRTQTNTYTYDLAFVVNGDSKVYTADNAQASITFNITGIQMREDGETKNISGSITLATASAGVMTSTRNLNNIGLTYPNQAIQFAANVITAAEINKMQDGDVFVINVSTTPYRGTDEFTNKIKIEYNNPLNSLITQFHEFLVGDDMLNGDFTLSFMSLDMESGEVSKQSITLNLSDTGNEDLGTAFKITKAIGNVLKLNIGDIANLNIKLYDIDKFWNSQGNFILDAAQTVTLTQSNGATASIILNSSDTLGSLVQKLNDAISNDLGQGADNIVMLRNDGTLEINLGITITFTGSADVIQALGFSRTSLYKNVVRILDSAGNVLWDANQNTDNYPKNYTFTATATNNYGSDSKELSITIQEAE